MAYQFNGALTVSELLSSSVLFQAAVRVLGRLRGEEPVVEMSEDEQRLAMLAARSTPLG